MLRIAFLHPDLGLGGAERLVVDAASGLAKLVRYYSGHRLVTMRCFVHKSSGGDESSTVECVATSTEKCELVCWSHWGQPVRP